MPDLDSRIRAAAGPAPAPPDLARVGASVRTRRRRRRGAAAGATALVLVALAAGVVAVRGGDPESQQVVTGPDGRTLTEPVGAWHQAAAPPFGHRTGALTATTDDGRILVWGGFADEGQSAWQLDGGLYDPSTDTWEPIPDAPIDGRTQGASAELEDDRLAIVTSNEAARGEAQAAVYDINEATWVEAPPTYIDNYVEASAWDGSTIAVVRVAGREEPLTLRWSIGDEAWTIGAPIPLEPRGMSASVGSPRGIVVWGGTTSSYATEAATPEPGDAGARDDGAFYDLAGDEWHVMAPGPLDARAWPDAVWLGDEVILGGGANGFDTDQLPVDPAIAAYDVDEGSWRVLDAPPADDLVVDWNGVPLPSFFIQPTASDAVTIQGQAEMHSGPQPRWFTLGDAWEQAPFYDLHDLSTGLIATSATIDNPGDGPFEVDLRIGDSWLSGAAGPFMNRMQPAVGVTGDHLLVVGGDKGPDLEPTAGAWVFDASG